MRIRLAIVLSLLVTIGVLSSARADLYVATNGSDSASRDSWPTAYTNIQDALDAAVSNDTIRIAGHTFVLTNQLLWTQSYVTIRGGYEATNAVGLGSNDPEQWPSVITRSSSVTNRIMHISAVTNGTLDKVTISGGYHFEEVGKGGGLFIENVTGMVVSACIITDNDVHWFNGNNKNEREYGGGVYAANSAVRFVACAIENNTTRITATWASGGTKSHGGGLYAEGGSLSIQDCLFSMNQTYSGSVSATAQSKGGAIYFSGGTHVLTNCLFTGNNSWLKYSQTPEGDAVYNDGAAVTLQNCTVAANNGEGVRHSSGSMTIRDSILWANGDDLVGSIALDHCSIEDGDSNGVNGNVISDPLFEYGFYLGATSTCINAGSTNAFDLGLSTKTTVSAGTLDGGLVDLGYHADSGKDASYADLYVVAGNSDANSGTNWANAIGTISEALSRAQSGTRMGSHIYVAAGQYTNGVETFPLTITRPGIRILATNRTMTVIDAGYTNRVFVVAGASFFRLEGMTITRGYLLYANGPLEGKSYGAGIYLLDAWDARIDDCVISHNWHKGTSAYSHQKGGGVCAYDSVVTISDCIIVSNIVDSGIGQTYGQARPQGNAQGGGVYAERGVCTIQNSVIHSNEVRSRYQWGNTGTEGAGLCFKEGTHLVRNSVIAQNTSRQLNRSGGAEGPFHGDGVYVYSAEVTLENCTIADNGAGNPLTPQGLWSDGNAILTNSILWGNIDDVAVDVAGAAVGFYSVIEDGDFEGANGCTTNDPQFVDQDYYHLRSQYGYYTNGFFFGGSWTNAATDSPAIDACAAGILPTDEPHPSGGLVNMGAYGNSTVASKSHPVSVTNLAASAITTNSVTFNGRLLHVGSAPAYAWIYWGLTDGTNNPLSWDDGGPVTALNASGDFATNVTGLLENSNYYYTCFASNVPGSTVWASPSSNVVVQMSAAEVSNTGVDNETTTSPTLKGEITSTGGDTPTVYICWGYTDGGTTSTGNWANVDLIGAETGAFSNTIATAAGSNYFYTCYATNVSGASWASPPLSFGTRHLRYVNPSASGSGTGYDWDNAFTSIQDALAACSDSKTNVLYLAGTIHVLPLSLNVAASHVTIKGGYEGSGVPGNSDSAQWPTIITNAVSTIRLFNIDGVEGVIIEDVTITGGLSPDDGGGILITDSTNVTLRSCTINGNFADQAHGGGLKIINSTNIVLDTCTVLENRAEYGGVAQGNHTYGGGMYLDSSFVLITNCVVQENTSYETIDHMNASGGGIYVKDGGLTLRDSTIYYNLIVATGSGGDCYGGGLRIDGSGTHTLKNCLIIQNDMLAGTIEDGHAVYGTANINIEGCTIAGNVGEGVRQSSGTMTITDTILWNNGDDVAGTMTLDHCNIEDGDNYGTNGCISTNSLFEFGYYLNESSSCVDSGSTNAVDVGMTNYTTRADGTNDTGVVDIGYHYKEGRDMTYALLYVDPASGNDSNSGTNWALAFQTVTKALNSAIFGSRIYLASGSYTNGAETFPLDVVLPGLWIIGSGSDSTILDAAGSSERVMSLQEVSDCRLEGITFANGYLSEANGTGGGLFVKNATGLQILSCIFRGNVNETALSYDMLKGGGVYAENSTFSMLDCVVVSNTVKTGQGVSYGQGRPQPNCQGAGMHVVGGEADIQRTLIHSNILRVAYIWGDTGYSGGGVCFRGGTHLMRNCLVAHNTGSSYRSDAGHYRGDGIGVLASANVTIENCTIVTNGFNNVFGGEGVQVVSSTINVTNCILWANNDDIYSSSATIDLNYSCIEDGDSNGVNGNIQSDPLFIDIAAANYRLGNGSPCANTGINADWMMGATDIEGNDRRIGGPTDMGCYESDAGAGTVFIFR